MVKAPTHQPAGRTSTAVRSPYLFAVAFAVVYVTFSVVRHARVETTGYDLGIFEQVVRTYSGFNAPIVPIKAPGFNILGDHFHPLLVLIAPFYLIWSDARTLLIVQAVLVAASLIPLGGLAVRRLGGRHGAALMVAYGLSWGIQGAIAFDFHEIALAVPLLSFSLVALVEDRPRAAVLWALPLLLVKEDMGLTVAAIGGYLFLKRRRRIGAALVTCGLLAVPVICLAVIPHFNPYGIYPYLESVDSSGSNTGLLHNVIGFPGSFVRHPAKAVLLAFVAATTAFAALRSPVLLIAAPILGYRLLSNTPMHWSTGVVHYNAILMPIVFVALIDAAGSMAMSDRGAVRRYARLAIPATLTIAVASMPFLPFGQMFSPDFYRPGRHAAAARQIIRMVPDGARVAAGNKLAPQLTGRAYVVLFPNRHHAPIDWVVVDTERLDDVPAPRAEQRAALEALPGQGFQLVAQRDGIRLYHSGSGR